MITEATGMQYRPDIRNFVFSIFRADFWSNQCILIWCDFMQFLMSHDILGAFFGSKVVQFVKDWTFWRVPKTGYFFVIVLCTKKLCILWRTERFGWQKIWHFWTFFDTFDTDFGFVLKVSRFRIPQMYIYDFCMFTPILVRLRRHTLCECNLVTCLHMGSSFFFDNSA